MGSSPVYARTASSEARKLRLFLFESPAVLGFSKRCTQFNPRIGQPCARWPVLIRRLPVVIFSALAAGFLDLDFATGTDVGLSALSLA